MIVPALRGCRREPWAYGFVSKTKISALLRGNSSGEAWKQAVQVVADPQIVPH